MLRHAVRGSAAPGVRGRLTTASPPRRVWRACGLAGGADAAVDRAVRLARSAASLLLARLARDHARLQDSPYGDHHAQNRCHLLQSAYILLDAQARDCDVSHSVEEVPRQVYWPHEHHKQPADLLRQSLLDQRIIRQVSQGVEFDHRWRRKHVQVSKEIFFKLKHIMMHMSP